MSVDNLILSELYGVLKGKEKKKKWKFPDKIYKIDSNCVSENLIKKYKYRNVNCFSIISDIKKDKKVQMYKELKELRQKVKNILNTKPEKTEELKKVIEPLAIKIKSIRKCIKLKYSRGIHCSRDLWGEEVYHRYINSYNIRENLQYIRNCNHEYGTRRRMLLDMKKVWKSVPGAGDYEYFKVGKTLTEKDTFKRIYNQKRIQQMYKDKKPKTKRRYVGVELEFCAPVDRTTLGTKLLEAGVLDYCKWYEDHSLRPRGGENGHELAILATEKKIAGVLRRICKVLEEVEAKVEGRRCGLHVHLDVRNRNKETVYNNLVSCQKWLLLMTDPSRRDGEFCKKVKSRKFPLNFNGSRHERYKTINAASYYRHKTIEVRLHEGTVDFKNISNWVALLVKIVSHKKTVPRAITSIKKMKDTFQLDIKTEKYIRDKINYWKVKGGPIAVPIRPAARTAGYNVTINREIMPDEGLPDL